MVVQKAGGEAVEIVMHDDLASVCSGAPSTMTGSGRLEGTATMIIPSPVLTCDDGSQPEALSGRPLQEQLRDLTFRYDPGSDSLTDNFDSAWERVPAEDPSPEPATLGALAYGLDGDIYVAEWDGSNAVRIADGRPPSDCGGWGEYWGEGPIWSPDGRYLAYRHKNCDGSPDAWRDVVISDPEGNVVAEFPAAGWDISWSPDSTRVAVWVNYFETIGVFGVDGVRQALLTPPPGWEPSGDHDPEWLPDGESLLVNDVVVPIDGSTPNADPRLGSVTFSPDGSHVVYVAKRSLVVAGADGSNPQVVFDEWPWRPVWSPRGDRVAFTSGRGRPNQLRVLDVATGTVTLLAEAEGSDAGTEAFVLFEVTDFSTEGDRILFSRMEAINDDPSDPGSYRIQGPGSLWSINADGSHPRRLVAGTTWADWLSPSPRP